MSTVAFFIGLIAFHPTSRSLHHTVESSVAIPESLWKSLLVIVGCNLLFINRSWSVRGVVFRFPHFPFLFGESDPECTKNSWHTWFSHTNNRGNVYHSHWCVFIKRNNLFHFFGVMSIFTFTKTKIIPGFKINTHLQKTQAVNWWNDNLSHQDQSEPVFKPIPINQGHAFTETQGKQPSFDHLQPTELDFYWNKCLFQ